MMSTLFKASAFGSALKLISVPAFPKQGRAQHVFPIKKVEILKTVILFFLIFVSLFNLVLVFYF